MNEHRQEPPPRADRVSWGLFIFAVLTLCVAADPPFGFGSLSIVASVVSGALLGLLVSRYYSWQATEEIRREAENLRRESEELHYMTMRMLQSMSGGHQVAVHVDEHGRPIGLKHHVNILHDQLPIADHAEPKANPPGEEGG